MKDKGLRGFIGTLQCLVGLHDWSDRQWAVPRCARSNCYKFKKRKQPNEEMK
jgi:hypothetical protein